MLSTILAIAGAAPSGLYHSETPIAYETVYAAEPELHHVGSYIEHIPTATSYQSRTDYHSEPVVKSILGPVEYIEEHVHHAPAIAYTSPAVYAPAAVYADHHHSHPIVYSSPYEHDSYAHSSVHDTPLEHLW